jgi:predicted MFS family arabinose efflux permease
MRERHLIALLTTIQFVNMVDFVMMMPLAPLLMRDYRIGAPEFAWMLSAYTFAAAASGLLAGFVMDRFNRRRALLVLLAGFALATIACGLAPSHWWMVVARAAAGFFGGVLGALVMAIVPDAIPVERRGQALGIIMASFSLASIVGIPLGMILAVGSGWHTSFLCLGGVGFAILAWCWAAFPSMTAHIRADRPSPLRVLAEVARVPNHWRAFALMIALSLAGFTVIPFFSAYLVGNVGLRDDHLKYVYLIGGIFTVVTSPLIGRLGDRVGAKPMLAVIGVCSLAPLLVATNLPAVPLWQALTVTTVFIVCMSGRFVPAMTLTANAVEPRLRGSFMGFNSALQSLATGAAAQLAGMIVIKGADERIAHYDVVGWVAAGFTVLALIAGLAIRPAARQPVAAAVTP